MTAAQSTALPVLQDVTFNIEIHQGKGLVAKDKNMMGKRTTSDPFVEVYIMGRKVGKTSTKKKTLAPVWNETVSVKVVGGVESAAILQDSFLLCISDEDKMSSSDPMGTVEIPCKDIINAGTVGVPKWYPVGLGSGKMHCKNATGDLQVSVSVSASRVLPLVPGNSHPISGESKLRIGLSWDMEKNVKIDLDASCVAIAKSGRVLTKETVYYGNLENPNGSISHSGDEKSGEAEGDDEVIKCDLSRIPEDVMALYFIVSVVTPEKTLRHMRTARVGVSNATTGKGICQFNPHLVGEDSTSMFLARLSRDPSQPNQWVFSPIQEGHPTARDFGMLIPHIKAYSRDILPSIEVDPNERMAIMPKNGVIRVKDFCPSGDIPTVLTFGLSWDVTEGASIDLDASVICLDQQLKKREIIYYGKLKSDDGAIEHAGDSREGEESGDDELIKLSLDQVDQATKYIGIVVNSYSGQELDDVAGASCHLFEPTTKRDLAVHGMTNSAILDKHTALVMACLYRFKDEWLMRIIGEPAQGKTAYENVDELQNFLKRNRLYKPVEVGDADPEIDVSMPAHKPHNGEQEIEDLPVTALQEYAQQKQAGKKK